MNLSGLQRNPNLNLHQEELKLGKEACLLEPWGHNMRDEDWLAGDRPSYWWTGKKPEDCPGFVDGVLVSLPLPNLNAGSYTRQSLLDYFDNTWTITEVLFSALQSEEPFFRPPYHQLRHPLVFYYVHPAALYVNKFRLAGLLDEPTNQIYEQLFETGVDEMSWDDMSKNCESWPTIRECTEYRRVVYKRVRKMLQTHPKLDGQAMSLKDDVYAVAMVFEHERIHIETTSVLMRELPVSLIKKPPQWPSIHPSAPADSSPSPVEGQDFPVNRFVGVAGGIVELGRGAEVDSFGWDNEFGSTEMNVQGFEAQEFLITNGQYWEFVRSGAYVSEEYWTPEGWGWRVFRNAKWPTFWVPDGPQGLHQYKLRVVFDIIPMPWAWPAVVNLHEAKAYCNWLAQKLQKPCRIPTESEHRLMRNASTRDKSNGPERDPVLGLRGDQFLEQGLANMNLGCSSEGAVNCGKPSSAGIYDSMGNVWVWCEDWFCPLDGFRVHHLYDDFSTPCFDGKHSVIMGGSFISTGNEASIHARFHFRPHFFQHAGCRVVIGEGSGTKRPSTTDQKSRREVSAAAALELEAKAERLMHQVVHLHYAGADRLAPPDAGLYPKRCAELVADLCSRLNVPTESLLDLGCSVGGTCFQFAQSFGSVMGIDLDEKAIKLAETVKSTGSSPYTYVEEGNLVTSTLAKAPECDRSRVKFLVADACCLPPDLGIYSVVFMANLIDRICSPKSVLGRMAGLKGVVQIGGLLVNVSSYTWDEAYTNEGAWLGGMEVNGQECKGVDGLRAALGDAFEYVEERDLPFSLREHARKYQYVVGHVTVWRRIA
eukprot:CAMPEP_0174284918 /NCGR_PEP_ID=MMETSP0809-20121228/7113_1 /TAXON_ID=73025 ORGANISM="Eutreptiella gymnastica-like, Strain CCMP1594" /NCGR_SAMPLE_ID=MMETSP0809 /ASSEMBLY_ACC=CAM_ASM_000658 /LENGTH=819 /DNA_ID=CAMNT_0015380573 /DNA_START=40 /DNA_END=2499 /DNA_ORIENTATION=-